MGLPGGEEPPIWASLKFAEWYDADISEAMLQRQPMKGRWLIDPDSGELVPRHHITQLSFANNGEIVMVANFSTAVSRNPYLNFRFRGARPGDTLKVSWVDNLGGSDELETVLV